MQSFRHNTNFEQLDKAQREAVLEVDDFVEVLKMFCDCGRNGGYRCVCDRTTRGREDSRDCP